MNILFLVHRFYPSIGGLQSYTYTLARELIARGHEVSVYTSVYDKTKVYQILDGIQIYRFPMPISMSLFPPLYIMPSMLVKFFSETTRRADIICSFRFDSFPSVIGAQLKFFYRKPFILRPNFDPTFGSVGRRIYDLTIGNMIVRLADVVIVQSDAELNLVRYPLRSKKIIKVPNGINVTKYANLPEKSLFKERYKIDPKDKLVLFVGKISFWKGFHHLLLAFSHVTKKIENVKLIVVSQDKEMYQKMSKKFASSKTEKISYFGPLTGESLLSAYVAADVCVYPSKCEAFGNVVLEAAVCGVPVIATKTGIAPEIIEDQKTGLFVQYGNVRQLSDAINEVLNDDTYSDESKKARQIILEKFSLKNHVDKIVNIYTNIK